MLRVASEIKIGFQHGRQARSEIARGIKFYEDLFVTSNELSWPEACEFAEKFLPILQREYPDYLTEMKGRSCPRMQNEAYAFGRGRHWQS